MGAPVSAPRRSRKFRNERRGDMFTDTRWARFAQALFQVLNEAGGYDGSAEDLRARLNATERLTGNPLRPDEFADFLVKAQRPLLRFSWSYKGLEGPVVTIARKKPQTRSTRKRKYRRATG